MEEIKQNFLFLEAALKRRLLAINHDIRSQRKVKPANEDELTRLKSARSTTDKSYSAVKLSIERQEFDEELYGIERQAYMDYPDL